MKKLLYFGVLGLFLWSCKGKEESINYASYGMNISVENAVSNTEMMAKFAKLKAGDTLNEKFISKVNKVCKSKGCWMKIDLGTEESMVKFKDYGFFVPMDSEERKVVVQGKAYVTEQSIEDQKHYAKDEGKSEAEINLITETKYTYAFLADGVLMEE
jgi:hypothetical protein